MSMLTSEMKKLIEIKNNCKHYFENTSILFYDQDCLNEYKKVISRINYLTNESNQLKENLSKVQ